MKKAVKIIIPIIVIIILAAFTYFLFLRKQLIKEVSIIKNEEKYSLKIDYPIFYNKKIDDKIKKYINDNKKNFMKIVDSTNNATSKYNLLIQTEVHKNNGILYITILNETYTGGAHYIKDYYNLYYDIENDKLVDINYFLKDENAFNKLYKLAHYHVIEYASSTNKNFDDAWVRRGTEPKLENYSYFTFTNKGLKIIFKPYQVASYADGEIKITIPYEELTDVIKDRFVVNNNKKVEKLIPEIRDLSKYQDKKLIAFTFDDGPNTETTKILLDGLSKYDAKVTFFVLGNRVNRHNEILKRAYLEGNQIGSHTYNHKNLKVLDNVSALNEINDTNNAIKSIIGVNPKIIRPPYGNVNKNIDMAMPIVLWNIDTLDWKYRDKNKVADEIVKNAHDGAIVLMHDIYKSSVEGALMAMERLKDEYYFVTIEEMAALKNIKLENNSKYFNIK